jgi:hypothetical protein
MKGYLRAATGAAVLAGLAVACSDRSTMPSPLPAESSSAPLGADGSNLKVTAPTPIAPINDFQTESEPVLTASTSVGRFATVAVQYNFEVYNDANVRVVNATVNTPSYTVTASLDFEKRYTWRVRAVSGTAVGPWSTVASFKAPVGGYIKNQEIFDPLTNGKTVGHRTVDVTFTAAGVRLNGKESVVEYRMPQTLTGGEFSAIITNLGNGSEEWKTKVMSMLADDGVNVTDNEYRVTIDKRTTWFDQGSPARFTFCVRSADPNASHCPEPNAGPQQWDRTRTYFWKFTWGNGVARLVVLDGGVGGTQKVNISAGYSGVWNPAKMLVRLGSVNGRAGSDTNPGTTIRNVWVSANPRPTLRDDR